MTQCLRMTIQQIAFLTNLLITPRRGNEHIAQGIALGMMKR